MNAILELFNINNIFFTLIGYQMSYIEFFGTIFTVWCVYLTAKAKILSWPVGLVGCVLYLFLFYQIQLYSDFFEQIYFLLTGIWGWWIWTHPKRAADVKNKNELKIGTNSLKLNVIYLAVIAVGTIVFTYVSLNLSNWLPVYFPLAASYPFLDAFTTIMSFVAQWLLAKKKFESWILWIIVDAIGIWLYWTKGVKFISLEYVLFLVIAIVGLVGWIKEYKSYKQIHEQAA